MLEFLSNIQWSNLSKFSKWVELATPKNLKWGVFPPFSSLLTFILVSGLITGAGMAWAAFTATAASWTAIMGVTFPALVGTAFLNFWFNRDILTFTLASRKVVKNFVYDKEEDPKKLQDMVEHLTAEVNMHFARELGGAHRDIHVPRICTFTEGHFQIITAEGRNPGKSAIFISDGALKSHETRMTQRQLAALIQKELVKIYLRRGVARSAVGIGTDFLKTIDALQFGNIFFKSFYLLLSPFKLATLFNAMIQRSYEYEACEVVAKIGRGLDLHQALDRKVSSSLDEIPTRRELNEQQVAGRREPFEATNWIGKFIKPLADWVDANEAPDEDRSGYRFISFFDICVREIGFFVDECFKSSPRITNVKPDLERIIKDKEGTAFSMAYTRDVPCFMTEQEAINQSLWTWGREQASSSSSKFLPVFPANKQQARRTLDSFEYAPIKMEEATRNSRSHHDHGAHAHDAHTQGDGHPQGSHREAALRRRSQGFHPQRATARTGREGQPPANDDGPAYNTRARSLQRRSPW